MTRNVANLPKTTYPYLLTAVGVGLMALSTIYGYVRLMMFRAMFNQGANQGMGYTAGRHFGGGYGYGLPSMLTLIALVLAIVGLVWLGLVLRSRKRAKP